MRYYNRRFGLGVFCIAVLIVLGAIAPASGFAAIATQDTGSGKTATDLAQALAGSGIAVSNATFTGDPSSGGVFVGGTPSIGFDSGVVLSSGAVANVIGPNDSSGKSTSFGTPGDPDLDALTGGSTNDASVLQFDFVPTKPTISFSYVFGSEEYNEYVNKFNDAFAFFVNGANCALVPGTTTGVTINNINNSVNPAYFRDNTDAHLDTQLDGLTTTLTCTASVTPSVSNHIKLAIADALDTALDSAVLLKADSFVAGTPPTAKLAATPNTGNAPLATSFSTAGTTDAEGPIASWSLSYGDGSPASGGSGPPPVTIPHTYSAAGSYVALLTVIDGDGSQGTATAAVTATALNTAPKAKLTATPSTGQANLAVALSTAGTTDAEGPIASYSLNYGDGSPVLSAVGPPPATFSHTYVAGTYTATLKVTDGGAPALSATATATITVTRRATSLTVNPAVLDLRGLRLYLNPSATLRALNPTAPLGGKTVVFTTKGTFICAAVTRPDGTAACSGLAPLLTTVLGLSAYDGSFAGDATYLPSTGKGPLIGIPPIRIG